MHKVNLKYERAGGGGVLPGPVMVHVSRSYREKTRLSWHFSVPFMLVYNIQDVVLANYTGIHVPIDFFKLTY